MLGFLGVLADSGRASNFSEITVNPQRRIRHYGVKVAGTSRSRFGREIVRSSATAGNSSRSYVNERAAFWVGGADKQGGVRAAIRNATENIPVGVAPQVAMMFVSSSYSEDYSRVCKELRKELSLRAWFDVEVIGTSVASMPLDLNASIAVVFIRAEDSRFKTFKFDGSDNIDLDTRQEDIRKRVLGEKEGEFDNPYFLLFHSEDYSSSADVLSILDFAFPKSPKFGGHTGVFNALHQEAAFCGSETVQEGLVGLAMEGDFAIDLVVSQGARSVGPMLSVQDVHDESTITKVKEVGTAGETKGPPWSLFDMWQFTGLISEADKKLAEKCTTVGIGIETFEEGKEPIYLIRRISGIDKEKLSISVEGKIREQQIIQYQVRDEYSTLRDLENLLNIINDSKVEKKVDGKDPIALLFFSDLMRGADAQATIKEEIRMVLKKLKLDIPVFGTLSTGQVGPLPAPGFINFYPIKGVGVSGATFQHTTTSVFALIYG